MASAVRRSRGYFRDPYDWIISEDAPDPQDAGESEMKGAKDDAGHDPRPKMNEISTDREVWERVQAELRRAQRFIRSHGQVEEHRRNDAYSIVCGIARVEVRQFLKMFKDDIDTWTLPPFENLTYVPQLRPGALPVGQFGTTYVPLCQNSPSIGAALGCTSISVLMAVAMAYQTTSDGILGLDVPTVLRKGASTHRKVVKLTGGVDKFMDVTEVMMAPSVQRCIATTEATGRNDTSTTHIARELRSFYGMSRALSACTTYDAAALPELPLVLVYMEMMSRRLRLPVTGVFTRDHRSISLWTHRADASKDENLWMVYDSHNVGNMNGNSVFHLFFNRWDFLNLLAPEESSMYSKDFTMVVYTRMMDNIEDTYHRLLHRRAQAQ